MAENLSTPAGYTDKIIVCAEEVYKDENGELKRRQGWKLPLEKQMQEIVKGNCDVVKIEESRTMDNVNIKNKD